MITSIIREKKKKIKKKDFYLSSSLLKKDRLLMSLNLKHPKLKQKGLRLQIKNKMNIFLYSLK